MSGEYKYVQVKMSRENWMKLRLRAMEKGKKVGEYVLEALAFYAREHE